jgi:hypothetical protein
LNRTNIHFQWRSDAHPERFQTGVSLHSHTLHSRETLDFIYRFAAEVGILKAVLQRGERHYRQVHGVEMDLTRAWWTPPLAPRDAWKLEKAQINDQLAMNALVSLTDHDDIDAPMSLQILDECRGLPVSVEWTVPYRGTFFHLGVHNLRRSKARQIMTELAAFTACPKEDQLRDLLAMLADRPETLIVFNHPCWDESRIGAAAHCERATEFITRYGAFVHALELNGMRPWSENRAAAELGRWAGKPLISGGDRHGVEPNALVNLTNATTFAEFVAEVRNEGVSNVLLMSQYREAFSHRIAHNLMDVLRTYEDHGLGWKRWNDRVFYQCDDGVIRSLAELWGERPPAAVGIFVGVLQFASTPRLKQALRFAFSAREEVAL